MTGKFSENAKNVVSGAILAAKELGHTYVGTEHLLLSMTVCRECAAAKYLFSVGITPAIVKEQITSASGVGNKSFSGGEDMTPKCKKILIKAGQLAVNENSQIGSEYILSALLSEECVAKRILEMENVHVERLLLDINAGAVPIPAGEGKLKRARPVPMLEKNARELTVLAAEGKLTEICGREKEEERILRILLRKTKNNPCLIGEAGVGKTAVVESLAVKIANGNVPPDLMNTRMFCLETASLVAGTKYRGEFEDKLKNVIAEAKNDPDIILFIDELHTIVGAGSAEGSVDAANILKPALARGELRLIGATTPKEYKKSVERDAALERRFQPVIINEPSEDECIKMLFFTKTSLEKHHKMEITDLAVRTAVNLSARYIHERHLPDKAIDLLDEAAAGLRLYGDSGRHRLTENDIARVAEETTGIPQRLLCGTENRLRCEERIRHSIFGQEEAAEALCRTIRKAAVCLNNKDHPVSTLIFCGESGTGKRFCAGLLAECMPNRKSRLFTVNMSEYSEQHSVSKLIGSPPGYVGYGEGGILTERVRHNPYSVLIFEAFEKAHPDVQNLVCRIVEEGTLTDSLGTEVSFASTIVIISCASDTMRATSGFTASGTRDKPKLEFIPSGIREYADEVVYFKRLETESIVKIGIARAEKQRVEYSEKGISLCYPEDFSLIISEKAAESHSAAKVCAFVDSETQKLVLKSGWGESKGMQLSAV